MVPTGGSHGTQGRAHQDAAHRHQGYHRYEPSQRAGFPRQQTAAALGWFLREAAPAKNKFKASLNNQKVAPKQRQKTRWSTLEEKSTRHVGSRPNGCHVNRGTAHALIDLNLLYIIV
jgi:hypothetical protein